MLLIFPMIMEGTDPQSKAVLARGVPSDEEWSQRQRIIWILFTWDGDHLELAELIMFCRVQCNYF